jgi:type IV pilus assembly protein PilA
MRNKYSRRNKGFSLTELLIVVAIIMVLAAIALPYMNQALMLARETAAMKQVGSIQTAETQYYAQFGKFAMQLSELGPASNGQPGPNGAGIISAEFAQGNDPALFSNCSPLQPAS